MIKRALELTRRYGPIRLISGAPGGGPVLSGPRLSHRGTVTAGPARRLSRVTVTVLNGPRRLRPVSHPGPGRVQRLVRSLGSTCSTVTCCRKRFIYPPHPGLCLCKHPSFPTTPPEWRPSKL
eukprot:64842-Hanusia_phi.AAC.1